MVEGGGDSHTHFWWHFRPTEYPLPGNEGGAKCQGTLAKELGHQAPPRGCGYRLCVTGFMKTPLWALVLFL